MRGVLEQRQEIRRREARGADPGSAGTTWAGTVRLGFSAWFWRGRDSWTTPSSPVRRRPPNFSLSIGLMLKQFTSCWGGSLQGGELGPPFGKCEMTGGGDLGGRGVSQFAPQPLALSPQSGFQQRPVLLFCRQGGAMEGLEGVVVL